MRLLSSSCGTPGLRSSENITFPPFIKAFTHLRLTWKPIGPSIPPSVKSTSPNSVSDFEPSNVTVRFTFFSLAPLRASPLPVIGVSL